MRLELLSSATQEKISSLPAKTLVQCGEEVRWGGPSWELRGCRLSKVSNIRYWGSCPLLVSWSPLHSNYCMLLSRQGRGCQQYWHRPVRDNLTWYISATAAAGLTSLLCSVSSAPDRQDMFHLYNVPQHLSKDYENICRQGSKFQLFVNQSVSID